MKDPLGRRLEGLALDKWAYDEEERHPFLTVDQRKAAYCLAFGDDPHKVAQEFSIKPSLLAQWRASIAFQELEEIIATSTRMFRPGSFNDSETQIRVLNDVAQRIQDTIDARADLRKGEKGGAHTGLLVAEPKSLRVSGEEWTEVNMYRFDKAIVDSLQNVLKHIGELEGFYNNKGTKSERGKDKGGRPSVIRIKHATEAAGDAD